jgi:hypothetical protein
LQECYAEDILTVFSQKIEGAGFSSLLVLKKKNCNYRAFLTQSSCVLGKVIF